ncbi:zinc knuckle-domain-containing protein [Xylariaceae sp. FL0016]|nr:zinc knuckle-domain-containing protein [Xylariaceae sp. FL0016]
MWRRGPSKSTPTNVQCQKCLKRGHYSYECKATAQERPYVPRPSRTQQLLNPKLKPKLASDGANELQSSTKGLADSELAKREAERAKKRELERDAEGSEDEHLKKRRSASYDSVSSISTRGSRNSRSPPHTQNVPRSPPPKTSRSYHSRSPVGRHHREESYESVENHQRRYSPSPPLPPRARRGSSARPGSGPGPESPGQDLNAIRGRHRARDSPDRESQRDRWATYSRSPSRTPPREQRRRFRSRSLDRPSRRDRSPRRHNPRSAGHQSRGTASSGRGGHAPPTAQPARIEQRERSLSPFSKRLAMTQAMNVGR